MNELYCMLCKRRTENSVAVLIRIIKRYKIHTTNNWKKKNSHRTLKEQKKKKYNKNKTHRRRCVENFVVQSDTQLGYGCYNQWMFQSCFWQAWHREHLWLDEFWACRLCVQWVRVLCAWKSIRPICAKISNIYGNIRWIFSSVTQNGWRESHNSECWRSQVCNFFFLHMRRVFAYPQRKTVSISDFVPNWCSFTAFFLAFFRVFILLVAYAYFEYYLDTFLSAKNCHHFRYICIECTVHIALI